MGAQSGHYRASATVRRLHRHVGLVLEAARYAKERFGARMWLERGSTGTSCRSAISLPSYRARRGRATSWLCASCRATGWPIASRCRRGMWSTALRDPAAAAKLFVNPYGVSLEQFPLGDRRDCDRSTILFVGGWSYRKGSDLLVAAMQQLPHVRLLHVGGIVDGSFPNGEQFEHHASVPQRQLTQFYRRAAVFVLASREEGLAMVQAQALASGLPLVCTDRSGGSDLALTPALAERISVVPSGDATALGAAIGDMLAKVQAGRIAPLAASDRAALSWSRYGQRYADEIAAASVQEATCAPL